MLVKDLFEFKSIENQEGKIKAQVLINAKNSIFEEHFPNNPVTPGVIQVQLVKEILEEEFKQKFKLKTMGRCKFLAVLNPETSPEIEVEISTKPSEEGLKINAVGKDAENTYFKFSALYIHQ